MKRLRLCLLVLMAALLPLRGAMAAAMLCPPAGVGSQMELRVADHLVGHAHESAPADGMAHDDGSHDQSSHDHGSHDHAAHAHGTSVVGQAQEPAQDAPNTPHAETPGSTHDKCNMCSAFCSVTPLIGSLPTLVVPLLVTSQRYPTLEAPVPLFLCDGQDRPPRST